jgi:translation initiation factor IF-2
VIYELIDDVRDWLSSLLSPEIIETEHAKLKILGVFKTARGKVICGGEVVTGKIVPELQVKIIRKKKEIGTGTLQSLQKEKQPAKEVLEGEQCGLEVGTDQKIEVGDQLVFFSTEEKARRL